MSNYFFIIWVVLVVVLSVAYLAVMPSFDRKVLKIKTLTVWDKSAKEALEKIAQWTIWITSLQTGAIASMAFLIKDECAVGPDQKQFAFFSILFFGSSILLSAWVLSAIPSIIQRIRSEISSEENDVFENSIFTLVSFRLGHLTALVHWYFVFGIVFYSLFIYSFIQ